ncbi:MAG TPA: hypothetical protein VNO83_08370 [Pseudonocardia sp.]|nr:hypothetical protein [Pseudonocardia sp.]
MTAPTAQFTDFASKAQEQITTATRTWADALQTVTDAFTAERPALVEPAALVDNYFDFAQQVLNKQREFAQSAVSVGAEAAQSVTERATAAAKTVAGTK